MTDVSNTLPEAGARPDALPTHSRPMAKKTRRWSRRVAADIAAFLDVVCIVLTALPASILLQPTEPFAYHLSFVQVAIVTAAIASMLLRNFGCYRADNMKAFSVDFIPITVALATSLLITFTMTIALAPSVKTLQPWFVIWYTFAFFAILASRICLNILYRHKAETGAFSQRIAIYGIGRIADAVHAHVESTDTDVVFKGVFEDRAVADRLALCSVKPVGRMEDLIELGRNGELDKIIIALPQSADERIAQVTKKLEQLPVHLHICTHISSDFLADDLHQKNVSRIGPVGLLEVKNKPLSGWGPVLKSAEDYLLCALVGIIALPLFALIAIAIKLDSKGPVFFTQRRHGLNHRVINVFKFRTMNVMDDGHDVKQATKNDPRVTRVGKLLRRTSLDELPQLINVIKGEMSLVGPRPHALVHNEHYTEELERYANRHQVKPGITGWAQVNGWRGETKTPDAMKMRVEHDLAYIKNWSIFADFKILFMTPFYALFHDNAY